jgi:Uma2 family endonuclease
MVQPVAFVADPADPRAPPQDVWDRLTPAQRERAVAMLPADVPIEVMAPEGDPHQEAKRTSLESLGAFFKRIGRKVYLSTELAVYYPGQPRVVPDVLAVIDVEPHQRTKWVVSLEGKGLDFVVEVHVAGDKRKDHERKVARYAELGIPEYFIFDRGELALKGYALPRPDARAYQPILPQRGRFASRVLGLDLALEGTRLRFFSGTAPLPDAEELVERLESMVQGLVATREEAVTLLEQERERAEQERERAEQERERAEQEHERAEAAERRVAELEAELQRLMAQR